MEDGILLTIEQRAQLVTVAIIAATTIGILISIVVSYLRRGIQ